MKAPDLDVVASRRWRRSRRWAAIAALAAIGAATVPLISRHDGDARQLAVQTENAPTGDRTPTEARIDVEGDTTTSSGVSSTTTSSGLPPRDPTVSAQRRRPNPTTTTARPSTTTTTRSSSTTTTSITTPATTSTAPADPGGDLAPSTDYCGPGWHTPTAAASTPSRPAHILTEPGLYVVPIDGGAPRRILADSGLEPDEVVASPDGKRLVFTVFDRSNDGQNPFGVYAANGDGTEVRQIEAGTKTPQSLSWSPDGRWIAFNDESPDGGSGAVWVMAPDGLHRRKLWDNPSHGAGWIRWSPDSTRLATHSPSSDGGAWVIDLASGAARKIVADPVWVVDWAPDGKRLVVDITWPVDVDGPASVGSAPVIVITADGTGRRQIVQDGAWPVWSPAGDGIAFQDRSMTGHLIDPDTLHQRTYGPGLAMTYAPDGQHLAATGGDLWIDDRRGCGVKLFASNQPNDPQWVGWAGTDHILVKMNR